LIEFYLQMKTEKNSHCYNNNWTGPTNHNDI